MNYQIIIGSSTPEELLVPISQYWSYRNGCFSPLPSEFSDKRSSNKIDIKDILINSHCVLHLTPCALCQMPIKKEVNSRKEFREAVLTSKLVCENCNDFSPYLEGGLPLPDSLESSINKLNNEELKVLNGIVQLKTKFKIYRHIFHNNLNDYDTWAIINNLQKKNLIWIERDSSWKIKAFNYDPSIINFLL
ncbi:hypothetical protein [Autumnicola musiva]|uniref:Uncharacterized protein n=1 Tax=Autumnicola musiva TaxID=3075589 RepID=A0ABU3D6J0_9FLAO|nr:hypothetical protein [Zunongwangia sp. F117]MDT0676999.1 hypothetical protein [Zunongwangia sp. F117]